MTAEGGTGRRRRRRPRGPDGAAPAAAPDRPAATVDPAPQPAAPSGGERTGERGRRRPDAAREERALRDLVGGGRSQVGVSGALRARDVNRPTDDDLAQAERDLVIVRRNWTPPPA